MIARADRKIAARSAHLALLRQEYALDFQTAQIRHREQRVQSMAADLVGICFPSSDGIEFDSVLHFPAC
jgi:hypothetical protein